MSRIFFSLVLLLTTSLFAQQPTRVTSVEGITEYRLPNGLDVLLFPDPSKQTLTVNMTILVGSRHEGYGESGMAHLLEHLLFKGTQKRGEIGAEIRSRAGNYNGSTWYDRTNYFETMPASDENLKWTIDMEADRLMNSRVSRADLDSEMTVVRNEFERGENSPERVLEERVLSTAFLWHSYGRSAIGSRSDIENVPIDRLQDFYKRYYQPDNTVLVVAGKFDPAKALMTIQETFGAIPRPTRKLPQTYTEEPTQDGERQVVLERVGDNQALTMAYHVPSGAHPDMAALNVLVGVLGEQPSGRLYKALVDSKKAVSADAGTYELHDPGVFIMNATVRKEASLADAEKTMIEVIDGVVKEPPSKEEVDRAKTRQLKNIDLLLNNSERVGLALSEAAATGDWRLLFSTRDDLEKVSPADVARVAKLYLRNSNRTLGRFIPTAAPPERAVIPANPDLSAKLKDYKGKALLEDGEALDPAPASLESRITRLTLPGGLKLALVPKKTRGGVVFASLNLHFGDENSLNGKTAASGLAGAMLMRGTAKHSRQQLQDEMDKLKARITVGGGGAGAVAGIETTRANLAASLRLVAEILREPSFPENELELIRQASIGRIEAQRNDPQQMASNAMNRHFAPYPVGDPRAVMTPDENLAALKAVTLAQVRDFYRGFYGASNGELAVVGDFDPAEVRKLAEELLGSWKSPASYAVVKRDWSKRPVVDQMIEAPDKENAVFMAATSWALDQQDPDYPALLIGDLIFGADSKSRLWSRIREKDGLSYGVGTQFNAGAQEKFARLMAYAIANPGNVGKVEAAFKEELARMLRDGFTAEEVESAKRTMLQERLVQRSQDQGLMRMIASQAELGRTMAREADIDQKIGALTPAQVTAAMKKWLDPVSLSYFKSGDFKKAGVTK